ncbi:MAG: IS30 family transposase [Candidatus Levybacteria bacterium]|nr:IS30 family transposase [Candidatus Levybacteria bacterium]
MFLIKNYNHLNLEEREELYALSLQNLSLRKIAKKLGRSQSSLTRELKRNRKIGSGYVACKAQIFADKRAKIQRTKAPLKNIQIFVYVREHLKEPYFWSPEQIAGRLSIEYPSLSVNTETIYRYIYSKATRKYKLWRFLPLRRTRRMKKMGRKVKRYEHILGLISIDQRPEEVNIRQALGHWETDGLEGRRADKSIISTTVERLTRFTLLDKLNDRSHITKSNALINRLSAFPSNARITLTSDNGKENSSYTRIIDKLKLRVFFCHPYCPWEKGTVENTNGRIRRFLPKKTSLDLIPAEEIKRLEIRLNSTPRKCLDYLTPYERMEELLVSSDALQL